ncbi:MAG: tol-pal system-associated acyl-CoA thioesterase [Alphaproteobacteria bacterium]
MAEASSGTLADGRHIFPIRVYYEDTDAAGIVYYANYLKFAERGRTELMRALGAEHRALLASDGVLWAVRRCVVDYLMPARLDDRLDIVTSVADVGAARLDMLQVVRRGAAELARLAVRLACLDATGRPRRMPSAVRDALLPLLPPQARA